MMAIFGALLPRFLLLVGWSNDPAGGDRARFARLVPVRIPVLPVDDVDVRYVAPNGLSLLNLIFLAFALLADLGTWGIGAFATRRQVSSFRDM